MPEPIECSRDPHRVLQPVTSVLIAISSSAVRVPELLTAWVAMAFLMTWIRSIILPARLWCKLVIIMLCLTVIKRGRISIAHVRWLRQLGHWRWHEPTVAVQEAIIVTLTCPRGAARITLVIVIVHGAERLRRGRHEAILIQLRLSFRLISASSLT